MSPTVLARGQETLLTVAKVSNEILKLDIPSILNTDKKKMSEVTTMSIDKSTTVSTSERVYINIY